MKYVVHCKRSQYDVYIGRSSKWGNPFKIGRDGNRAAVIAQYEQWLLSQPELVQALPELCGKVLGCWCAPKPCHGDVLVRLANVVGSSVIPRGLIPGILDAHKQLWLSVRSGLASGKSVGYMRRRVARGVVVQTQNLNKRSSSNTKLCLNRAWNISWVFWEGKYFGKVVESDRWLTVWKLSDFTESGVDEVVYEVSNPPY